MRQRGKVKSKGARSPRSCKRNTVAKGKVDEEEIDLAKPQPADCHLFGARVNKALTGEKYLEFDPYSETVSLKKGTKSFVIALWDNQMPERWGEAAANKNVGFHTVEALRACGKVEQALLGRFFSCSGDPPRMFEDSHYYVRVFTKPILPGQIREIGDMYREWKLLSDASGEEEVSIDPLDRSSGYERYLPFTREPIEEEHTADGLKGLSLSEIEGDQSLDREDVVHKPLDE